jgi:RimJ/RimL family protein N-acetyltransferase
MTRKMIFKPMESETACQILAWRYAPPYDLYNGRPEDLPELVSGGYWAIFDGEELIGFVCFGPSARVPGYHYNADFLDMGLGRRPEDCGGGSGHLFVEECCDYARQYMDARALRLTVAAFNRRASAVYEKAGFIEKERFLSPRGREFIVMTRGVETIDQKGTFT